MNARLHAQAQERARQMLQRFRQGATLVGELPPGRLIEREDVGLEPQPPVAALPAAVGQRFSPVNMDKPRRPYLMIDEEGRRAAFQGGRPELMERLEALPAGKVLHSIDPRDGRRWSYRQASDEDIRKLLATPEYASYKGDVAAAFNLYSPKDAFQHTVLGELPGAHGAAAGSAFALGMLSKATPWWIKIPLGVGAGALAYGATKRAQEELQRRIEGEEAAQRTRREEARNQEQFPRETFLARQVAGATTGNPLRVGANQAGERVVNGLVSGGESLLDDKLAGRPIDWQRAGAAAGVGLAHPVRGGTYGAAGKLGGLAGRRVRRMPVFTDPRAAWRQTVKRNASRPGVSLWGGIDPTPLFAPDGSASAGGGGRRSVAVPQATTAPAPAIPAPSRKVIRLRNPSDPDAPLMASTTDRTEVIQARQRKTELRARNYPRNEVEELVDKYYNPEGYRAGLEGKDNVFLVMPSTTGTNILPDVLARKLQKEFRGEIVRGFAKVLASRPAKQKQGVAKLREPSGYEILVPVDQYRGRNVVIVDDFHTTGESGEALRRALTDAGLPGARIAFLGGVRMTLPTEHRMHSFSVKLANLLGKNPQEVESLVQAYFAQRGSRLLEQIEADLTERQFHRKPDKTWTVIYRPLKQRKKVADDLYRFLRQELAL